MNFSLVIQTTNTSTLTTNNNGSNNVISSKSLTIIVIALPRSFDLHSNPLDTPKLNPFSRLFNRCAWMTPILTILDLSTSLVSTTTNHATTSDYLNGKKFITSSIFLQIKLLLCTYLNTIFTWYSFTLNTILLLTLGKFHPTKISHLVLLPSSCFGIDRKMLSYTNPNFFI